MSDNQAAQVPLIQLLRAVPNDARAWYEHNATSHTHFPYGKMCHEAADRLDLQDELLAVQKEYIAFLTKILNKHSGFLAAHRCFDNEEEIVEGKTRREQIALLETKLKEG